LSIDLDNRVGPGYERRDGVKAVEARDLHLGEIRVCPVRQSEEGRFQQLLDAHHYLGAVRKISETLWYAADYRGEWVALLSFSAAAWKCTVRDAWIGWDYRHQYDRLKLIANNSRFLILPQWHFANLGSKVLSRCERRLGGDWRERFGHPLVLVETFVDPTRFHGTVYRAANWLYLGQSRGYSRTRDGYSATAPSPKKVFVKALRADARAILSRPVLEPSYRMGAPRIMLTADQMRSLPDFFADIPDPRRSQSLPPRRRGAGAIRCRRFWRLLPAPSCAACAGTRRSPNGPTTSPPRRVSASAAAAPAANTWCPVNSPSAIFSPGSIRPSSTWLCKGGTRLTARRTKAWPSTAKPCATPSTSGAIKPTS